MKTMSIPRPLSAAAPIAAPVQRAPDWLRPTPMKLLVLAVLALCGHWLHGHQEAVALLLQWTPALFEGFLINIWIGLVSVLCASVLGLGLGALQVSPRPLLARPARLFTLFFRNAPWLVVIFFMMYAIPFEVQLFGQYYQLPDWIKVALGLSLTAAGYAAEIVRGGIQSIPVPQWEAAASLGLDRRQILRRVVLPQALRSMLPAWMNLYCTVTMATALASLLGIEDLMTTMQLRLAGESRPDLMLPGYLLVFLVFFFYIYPISRLSRALERKWSLHD